MTYNLHKFFSPLGSLYFLEALKPALQELHLDMVFLQEVRGVHPQKYKNRFLYDPLEQLADGVWNYAAYGKNAVYSSGHHGNAILSKYPILDWQNYDLSNHRFEQRGLLLAKICPKGEQDVYVGCTHLDLTQWGRLRQFKRIQQIVNSDVPEGAPLILAGDLNDWNGFISKNAKKNNFESPKGIATFPSKTPLLALDRVLARDATIDEPRVISAKPWRDWSDHLPLRFDVR